MVMPKGQHAVVPLAVTIEALSAPLGDQDQSAAAPVDASAGERPAKAWQFVKGNKLARLKAIKNRARGITGLSPTAVPNFMKADLVAGVAYAGQLLRMLEDRPALLALAGQVADAYTVGQALMKEALKSRKEDDKSGLTLREKQQQLKEAQSWIV